MHSAMPCPKVSSKAKALLFNVKFNFHHSKFKFAFSPLHLDLRMAADVHPVTC